MADVHRPLLGQGEALTDPVVIRMGGGGGDPVYTLAEQKKYLAPKVADAVKVVSTLPAIACPGDEAVAIVTLNPQFIAKSAFPERLLRDAGLRTLGSKAVEITPRKWGRKGNPEPCATAELFVAGRRESFERLSKTVPQLKRASPLVNDFLKVEDWRAPRPAEKVKPLRSDQRRLLLEVVLHAGEAFGARRVLDGFTAYVDSLGMQVDVDDRIDAGELSFIPLLAPRELVNDVAQFSFLRLAREMPRLRSLHPVCALPDLKDIAAKCVLPQAKPPLDPTIKVALFDGGCPELDGLSQWVNPIDADDVIGPVEDFQRHGLAVTSAALFGPLKDGEQPAVPYAQIDHYRVLDEDTEKYPAHQLYPVLRRITSVLEKTTYDFVGLQMGPAIPVEDDDVHPWTAKLDPILSHGRTLLTVSCGNSGECDASLRLNRIQPPADLVNAMAIGACSEHETGWRREPWSSVGHGRSPGRVKPDGVVFSGTSDEPFWTVGFDSPEKAVRVLGTSFGGPNALRAGVGIRAHLGDSVPPLAVRALLTHNADATDQPIAEVGWGRIPTNMEKIIACPSCYAHVIYHGTLDAKKYLRVNVPVPEGGYKGPVTLAATICIATETDPSHPIHYTRSGLDITFRRDKNNVKPGKQTAKSDTFFGSHPGMSEAELRRDAHKWETVRRASRSGLHGRTLKAPCFDVHFNPREAGQDVDEALPIPYAMVVTIHAPKMPDIYDAIWLKYQFQLKQLVPLIELSVPVIPLDAAG